MFIRSILAVILGIGALSACADETRLHLEVDVDPALAIDSYELRVGDRRALAAPLAAIDVLVPDSMGGTTTNVELWGLHGGQQVAYGIAAVTPEAHGTVHVAVELVAVACGTWCQEGSVACGSEGGHDGTITCQQA